MPGLCPTYSVAAPTQMWLVDTWGRAVEPTLPIGECGVPNVSAIADIRKLDLVNEFDHSIPIVDPQRLRVSSCSPHFADPVTGTTEGTGLTIGYTYCLFDGFSFTRSIDEIRISIEVLPRAAPCFSVPTRKAVTTYVSGEALDVRTLTVELDGCRRVIPDGYAPLQASEEILSEFR